MNAIRLSSILLLAGVTTLAAIGCEGAASIPNPRSLPHQSNEGIDWRDQIIYQIVVDRWDDGDTNNDYNIAPSAPGRYHGGDWQGVIDHLDYLQKLGVTALWISPVFKNVEQDGGFASYHGYWPQDLIRTNPHFGDLLKLRQLVDAAHAHGMLVILDVVINHMGQLFYYDINGNGQPDDSLSGGGTSHTCVQICDQTPSACSQDEQTYCQKGAGYFENINEYDPEYDPRGVQGWTSNGFSGPAQIRFFDDPADNKVPPERPPRWFGWPDSKPWFDDPSWYHRKGRVYVWWHESDYSQDFVREQETTGDFPGGLKDLNTENPDVQQALIRSYEYWMDAADVDAFRVDTIKHMDRPLKYPNKRGFIGAFTDAIRAHAAKIGKQNFFIFGESFDGNDTLDGAYTFGGRDQNGKFGRADSVFYFSQYYRVINPVFKQDAPTRNIECLYDSRMGIDSTTSGSTWCPDNGYPKGPTYYDQPHADPQQGGIGLAPQHVLVNFLDNHDVARFMWQNATVAKLRTALFYLMTWDGIPCVYYGTEQLFHGGTDPRNREDMFRGNTDRGYPAFDTDQPTFKYLQALIQMRKNNVALRRGKVAIKWSTIDPKGSSDYGIFAFERATDKQKVLVVFNVAEAQESTTCAPAASSGACMKTTFAPGTVLKDIAPDSDGATFTVASDGTIKVTVPPRAGRLLVPAK